MPHFQAVSRQIMRGHEPLHSPCGLFSWWLNNTSFYFPTQSHIIRGKFISVTLQRNSNQTKLFNGILCCVLQKYRGVFYIPCSRKRSLNPLGRPKSIIRFRSTNISEHKFRIDVSMEENSTWLPHPNYKKKTN